MPSIAPSQASNVGVMLVAAAAVAMGAAYGATIIGGSPPPWAGWFAAFGGAAGMVGLFVIGAATRGAMRPLIAWLLTALFLVVFGTFGAALAALPPAGGPETIFLGLPRRLAIVFYGVGFLPLLVLPVTFALTFRSDETR